MREGLLCHRMTANPTLLHCLCLLRNLVVSEASDITRPSRCLIDDGDNA